MEHASNVVEVGASLGAATNSAPPTHPSGSYFHRRLREGFKQAATKKWRSRQSFGQFFSVVRHAERADGVYAFMDGGRWCDSDDYKRYPFDPPLSDYGREQAVVVGELLKKRADEEKIEIHVVVTSPYARCIETAAAIVQVNPRSRLLVDLSLGEIYGPAIFGPSQPEVVIRPVEKSSTPRIAKTIGKWPIWPEDLRSGRLRFASRFLTYLGRGNDAKRNFVLVTHGDCVAAALAMMPSQVNYSIMGVECGGLFVATRSVNQGSTGREFANDVTEASSREEEAVETSDLQPDTLRRCDSRTPSRMSASSSYGSETSEAPFMIPKSSDRWVVETIDILARPRVEKRSIRSTLNKLKKWCLASSLTNHRIEQLLGEIIDGGIGGEDSPDGANVFTFSSSEYVFGQSYADTLKSPGLGALNASGLVSQMWSLPASKAQSLSTLMKGSSATSLSPKRHGTRFRTAPPAQRV